MDNKKKGIEIFIAAILVISVFAAVAIAAQESSQDKAPTSESTLGSSGDSPWDVLFQHDVHTPTGDNQCLGVEFDGTFFWITGGGAGGTNKLHKFDKAGNYIISYNQPTTSGWGWRDLVWDGNYLYASEDDGSLNIDQIDPSTGAATGVTIPGPLNPNRGLAYDPATDHFWTANWGSDIYEIDRSGVIINQYPNALGIYGLAWDDISPDGPWLWIWSQDGNGCLCSQFDPRTGLFTGLTYNGAVPPGGSAGGACFARFGDIDVFVGLHQATPDTIVGYEITKIPAPVPTLTPIGLIALVGLLSAIAAVSIRTSIRKKR